jgi:hypothetical protein
MTESRSEYLIALEDNNEAMAAHPPSFLQRHQRKFATGDIRPRLTGSASLDRLPPRGYVAYKVQTISGCDSALGSPKATRPD